MAAAEEGFKQSNTLEATAKAAVAAWRSAQVAHGLSKHCNLSQGTLCAAKSAETSHVTGASQAPEKRADFACVHAC